MKIVLINGPAGSGKDTLAKLAIQEWGGVEEKFSAPLKAAYMALQPDADLVDRVEKEFHRANLIALSESYCKPRFGEDFFGTSLAKRIRKQPEISTFWVSDSRFPEEAVPLLDNQISVVKLSRINKNWDGDSGRYLDNIPTSWYVSNNGEPHDMIESLRALGFEDWLLRPASH
jgi:hypothetical protein